MKEKSQKAIKEYIIMAEKIKEGKGIYEDIKLGENLRRFREERSLTRENMAEILGLSVSFIEKIENGKKYMSLNNLTFAAKVLKFSVNDLLYSKEKNEEREIKENSKIAEEKASYK